LAFADPEPPQSHSATRSCRRPRRQRDDAEDRASGARAGHRAGLSAADVGQQGPAEMRPDSRRDSETIYGDWLGCSPGKVRAMRQGKVI